MVGMIDNPEIIGALVPIVAIGGYFWYKASKVHSNNELKRTMIEKGMSAEDIERVLRAGDKKGYKK